jgi:hypothetical protein
MLQTGDPDGRLVVLTGQAWLHILDGHPELEPHLQEIRRAIAGPTRRLPGRKSNEEWFFLEGTGPSRWLQVVVHFERGRGSITTAFGRRSVPWS